MSARQFKFWLSIGLAIILATLTIGIFTIVSLFLLLCVKIVAFFVFLWNQDYLLSVLAAILAATLLILSLEIKK